MSVMREAIALLAMLGLAACGGSTAQKKPTPAPKPKPAKPDPDAAPQLSQFVDEGKGLSAERMRCPEATRPRMVFTTGKLIARCEDTDRKPVGPVFHFHKGGAAAIAGTYAAGAKQVGTWRHWDAAGTLIAIEEYSDEGKLLRSRRPGTAKP